MSAQILSFPRTITANDIQQAMVASLLALGTERDDDGVADNVLARQLVTMAAAYRDLAAQIGIAPAPAIDQILDCYLT